MYLLLESERLSNGERATVTLKGTKEGLLLLLDDQAELSRLLEDLDSLLNGEKKSFFSGPGVAISIDYGNRQLSSEHDYELIKILHLLMEKDNLFIKEWGPSTLAKRSLFENQKTNVRQTLWKGTIRAGQKMVFDGDVVIIGDVNPGGEVQATGDIYCLGRLRGIAHAGILGDWSTIIAAAEFSPMQIRIADMMSSAPESPKRALKTTMEFAYLSEEGIAIDKLDTLHNWTMKVRLEKEHS
ncbi:septum site-determining protein MinC [Alicyclobacillus tolerans]|nr:septum site-determining protein MinC [Alicyclobacillus tengchongensis]